MTHARALTVGLVILAALAAGPPGRSAAQSPSPGITLSGRIAIQGRAQGQAVPRFTVRLYPPRETKEPMTVTYNDAGGNFRFTGLKAGRYLLEVRGQKNALAYQKVITLDAGQPQQSLDITLRAQ